MEILIKQGGGLLLGVQASKKSGPQNGISGALEWRSLGNLMPNSLIKYSVKLLP